jgi:hypothetical protein
MQLNIEKANRSFWGDSIDRMLAHVADVRLRAMPRSSKADLLPLDGPRA